VISEPLRFTLAVAEALERMKVDVFIPKRTPHAETEMARRQRQLIDG
jgi:hypothetical protein